MKKRNYNILLTAIAFLFVGIALLLDFLNVPFIGIIGIKNVWFPVLIILIGIALYLSMIIRRDADFIATATIITIIGTMLLLLRIGGENLTFSKLWPMIVLAPSIAFLFTYIFRSRRAFYLHIGLFMTAISIALLLGAIFKLWVLVAPIIIIFIGVIMCVYVFVGKGTDDNDEVDIPSVSIVARKQEIVRSIKENKDNQEDKQ